MTKTDTGCMSYSFRNTCLKIFLALIICIVYGLFLNRTPVYLNQDELGFSLNAYSIARTGFDENGIFLPLYFWHLGEVWATPIIVYFTSLFLTFLPLSETTIRLPSVAVGLINITLIYLLAKKIFNSFKFGLVAAILLAFTPIHFIQSRILLDNLYPVPFVLGWMYLLHSFIGKGGYWRLFLCTLLLGIGVHSYHAPKILMPVYFFITLFLTYFLLKKNKLKIAAVSILGFILPLLPLIPWLLEYPDTFYDEVRYTQLYDTKLSLFEGLKSLLTPEIIFDRLLVYLTFFDPLFLFLTGDIFLVHSTGRVGIFLLSFIVLLPIGIYQAIKKGGWFNVLLVFGFFSAPLAAAFVGHAYRASKELFILPFAVLLACLAIKTLWDFKHKARNLIIAILIVISALQFMIFLSDYFGDYRIRAYDWFGYNIRQSIAAVIEENNRGLNGDILLDIKNSLYFKRYVKYYLIKYNRTDLLDKIKFITPEDTFTVNMNTIVLIKSENLQKYPIYQVGLKEIKTIKEPDGSPGFYLFKK